MDSESLQLLLLRPMKTREVLQKSQTYLLQNYGRYDLVLERGNGVYVFDNDGERYLDCVAGISVNALGHGDYDVVEAIREQAGRLIHVSNLYHTIPAALLAEKLVQHSFADRVFFCNSGTESVEGAVKFARKWAFSRFGPHKHELVAAKDSFHGRTMGALSLTGQEKYQKAFRPLVPGVRFVDLNDVDALADAITDNTAAVILEPIQIESGVHPSRAEYLAAVREACDRHNALLIFDEVQTGLGRTGKLFAHEHFDVRPDIVTLAKPLGGGLPIGAVLMTQNVADAIEPGDHAATFGGGPVVCSVGIIVLEKLIAGGIVESVAQKGEVFGKRLQDIQERYDEVVDVRGMGMVWGVQLACPAAEIVTAMRARHILTCPAGPNVVRFVPPLIITEDQLHQVAEALDEVLAERAESKEA